MTQPKISIVVPNKNGVKFLETCLNSIFSQTYKNVEVILVDGNSTDGSKQIIEKFSSLLSKIIYLEPTGLYPALNEGFKYTSGEILCYLNSDDSYMPNALGLVAQVFCEFQNVSWLTGQPLIQDEVGHLVMSHPVRRWSKFDYALGDYKYIQQESTFWRADLWKDCGGNFNENFKVAGDLELWSRFFSKALLYSLNAPVAAFRVSVGNTQLSQQDGNTYEQEASKAIKTFYELLSMDEQKRFSQILFWKQTALQSWIPNFLAQKARARESFLKQLPPKIIFDRHRYALKLSDED